MAVRLRLPRLISQISHTDHEIMIIEDGTYELVEWPCSCDHSCWADSHQVLIRKAKEDMLTKVEQKD